ncbi:MAG: transglutaminase domain-containing protein [Elusimicrobia bacterium]|nr:transglutaminase domain-containing protein [Elusimicrobiota bacterium]
MKAPPGLLAAALLFWGWQTGQTALALAMAALVESHRFARGRWDLARDDFSRVSDFCTFFFLVLVAIFALRETSTAILGIVRWLPLNYLPILAAQAYSAQAGVDREVFFLVVLRRSGAAREGEPRRLIDLSYPYAALCVLAAAASNQRGPGYYAGACLIAGGALWSVRPRAWSAWAWVPAFAAAACLGGAGHVALYGLQLELERNLPDWVTNGLSGGGDALRGRTSLGHVGRLKFSGAVLMRVKLLDAGMPPPYLYGGVYNLYNAKQWFGRSTAFTEIPYDGGLWRLGGGAAAARRLSAVTWPREGKALLALPAGTSAIRLNAESLQRSRYGSVRGRGLESPAMLESTYDGRTPPGAAPEPADVELPRHLADLLRAESGRLGLAGLAPSKAMERLESYFGGFRYTLNRSGAEPAEPISDFLLRARAGHCEYFATSAALLLRAAGIPARYATGFIVRDYSSWEGAYLVRSRHAHAWTLAWDGGAWRVLDATPAAWLESEEERPSWWEPLMDKLSYARLAALRWRSEGGGSGVGKAFAWLLLPAGLYLLKRLSGRRRRDAAALASSPAAEVPKLGTDSELYEVLEALERGGWGRREWEPLSVWLKRLEDSAERRFPLEGLREAVALHERYRYDPNGLTPKERAKLCAASRQAALDAAGKA